MPSDRHTELQNMVQTWINNRSFKMCGLPECGSVGYIADFVAIAGMQDVYHTRYANHAGLKMKTMSRTVDGFKVTGDIDRWYVCVFEVKVSRADFLSTFRCSSTKHARARRKPVGTAHWVVADKGICVPDELPDFWGLLIPYGAGLTEKKMPKIDILDDSDIHAISFDMMWLQMNFRTSYYNQLVEIGGHVKKLSRAVYKDAPKVEILERLESLRKDCRGHAG